MRKQLKPCFGFYSDTPRLLSNDRQQYLLNRSMNLRMAFLENTNTLAEKLIAYREHGCIRFNYPFKTKEEYLEWKREWRDLYNCVSYVLKQLKHIKKDMNRKFQNVCWSTDFKKMLQYRHYITEARNNIMDNIEYDFSYEYPTLRGECYINYFCINADYAFILLEYYKVGKKIAAERFKP